MKTLFISFFVLILSLSIFSQGEDYKLKSITASLGKGALSSGYDITVSFSHGQASSLSVTGNHTRVYGTYTWEGKIIDVVASGGFFKNSPWVGPLFIFKPTSFLSTSHWYGICAGHPDAPAWKVNVLLIYNAVTLSLWNLQAVYAVCKFDTDQIDYLPGIKYTDCLSKDWSYAFSVDYSVRDQNPLFVFSFKKVF